MTCARSEQAATARRLISIDQRGIATQGNRVDSVILFSVGAPQQFSTGRNMQGHDALEFDCTDLKCSRWDEDRAAAIVCAGIDCRLKRGSVECGRRIDLLKWQLGSINTQNIVNVFVYRILRNSYLLALSRVE
jgi:hypothetical protein